MKNGNKFECPEGEGHRGYEDLGSLLHIGLLSNNYTFGHLKR